MNLTEKLIQSLEPRDKMYSVKDGKVGCLCLRVLPSGKKTFVLSKRIKGKRVNVTIHGYPLVTLKEIRVKANEHIVQMVNGINPNELKKGVIKEEEVKGAKALTVKECFDQYLADKSLKDSTRIDVERVININLKKWQDRKLYSLNSSECLKEYIEQSKQSAAKANSSFTYLKAVYNYMAYRHLDSNNKKVFVDNPVSLINESKSWIKTKRRKTVINKKDLPLVLKTITTMKWNNNEHSNIQMRSLLLTMLFTGLRSSSIRQLATDKAAYDFLTKVAGKEPEGFIEWEEKNIHLMTQKNGEEQIFPLSTQSYNALLKAKVEDGKWLFIGLKGNCLSYSAIASAIAGINEVTGVKVMGTDFRRTYLTIGAVTGLSDYVLKTLVGHTLSGNNDVTAGYISFEEEPLRKATQQIANVIMKSALQK